MATYRLKFRSSTIQGREGTLFFRVIHGRETRQVSSGCKLLPEEWNEHRQAIIMPMNVNENRRSYLAALKERIEEEKAKLKKTIARLERSGKPYTVMQVVEQYFSPPDEAEGFLSYAHRLIARLKTESPVKAKRYGYCVKSFTYYIYKEYGMEEDIPLNHMDADLMKRYEHWLQGKGVCPNSISHYIRNLRAVYNRAVEEGLTPQHKPFSKVYTGIAKTRKRAIPMSDFAKIQALDLPVNSKLALVRDLFIFLFLTQGMSFVDMAYLKKKDIREGMLTYFRKKTGQRISVKWLPQMQAIVNRYGNPASPYLLPIITEIASDTRRQYQNALHLFNHNLKKVGRMAGISVPLTSYVARHGWASNARNENVPVKTISQALGHENVATTQIYLTQIDTHEVDRANAKLIRCFARETDKQRKKVV